MNVQRSLGTNLTGYGSQTGLFAPLLKKHWDLALSSFYGLEGGRLIWGGIPVLPGMGQDFGNIFLHEHAKAHFGGDPKGGLVVTLHDVWVLDAQRVRQMNVASWCPVDHEPPPPMVVRFFKESGAVPIAMSRFGEEQLRNAGLDPLYCPHGVDTKVYQPHDKSKVRQEAGVPNDVFLVGMVAANKGAPSRKGFQQALEAFSHFHAKHKDSLLYLHTVPNPKFAGGEDILAMAQALGLSDSVVTAPQYRMLFDPMPPATMAQLYSSFDVLINPSTGEGFGIPILEAASCGVPAIVTNFSSMPEVSGPAGWHVGCRPYWTPGKSWQAIADVPEIVEALEQCYSQSAAEKKARSEAARNHALTYDVETVMSDHMLPALESAWERFQERVPLEPVAAAA